jgi:Domain of unknown function (DUF5666)
MSERNHHVPSRFSLRRNSDDSPTAEVSMPEPLVPAEIGNGGRDVGGYETARHQGGAYEPTVTEGYPGAEGDYDGDAGDIYPEAYEGELVATGPGALNLPELDDDDEAWLTPDTRRRIKIAIPTFLLGALAVIAGAFWGGAVVQKHFGTNTAATAAGAFAGRGGAGGAEGFAGFGGRGATGGTGAEGAAGASGSSGASGFAGTSGFGGEGASGFTRTTPTAEGTISAISGDDLTVKPASGADVKVVMNSSTTVTRSGKGSAGALKVGDTVRVVGTKASSGTVTATSITATAAGVSTATGGFGGAATGGTGFSGVGAGGSSTGGSSTPTVANGGFSGDGSDVSGG